MNFYHIFYIVIINVFSINFCFADNVPFYNDGILTLPIVDSLAKPGAFQDVTFEYTEQEGWQLLKYRKGTLYSLDTIKHVEIIKTETFPVQVFLQVTLSLCASIGPIRTVLMDHKFNIYMYQHFFTVLADCLDDFPLDTEIIPLDLYSLKKGEYEYNVNDIFTGYFSLAKDNEF